MHIRILLAAACAVAILGGRSGATPHSAATLVSQRTTSTAFARSVRARPQRHFNDRTPSWMSPAAKSRKALLYVADEAYNAVFVYTYPGQKTLVGKLTYFEYPYGLCSDKAGNVFVSDFGRATVYEYAHGETSPKQILHVTGSPIGCAVDARSGDLAVTSFNGVTPSTGAGGVYVFVHATGTPTLYQNPAFFNYWPPGYDDRGNLFVEGASASATGLAELPAGSSTFTNISLNATIDFPAGVSWDGTYVAAADQGYQGAAQTAVYQVSVSGSAGTVVHTVTLAPSPSCTGLDIVEPWIDSKHLVGGNLDCPSVSSWKYPKGGSPTATSLGPPYGFPTGQTVSTKR